MKKSETERTLSLLLNQEGWQEYQPLINSLRGWEHWELFLEMLSALDLNALYKSPLHGIGHIERTMLFGALEAMEQGLDKRDTELLLLCCSYHDVGRINDHWDTSHGQRSAQKLACLTGKSGQELKALMCAVEAHSMPDVFTEDVVAAYAPEDPQYALRLSALLKDADGLDRVRINDLDPDFLRFETNKKHTSFAHFLFDRYERAAQGFA